MSMTREERHALAARIRLGETVPEPRFSDANPWLQVETVKCGDVKLCVKELCFGVLICHKVGMNPYTNEWVWEDGTPMPNVNGYQRQVLEYLERP